MGGLLSGLRSRPLSTHRFAVSDQDARFQLMLDLFVEGLAKRARES
jgi:hypothetical protein